MALQLLLMTIGVRNGLFLLTHYSRQDEDLEEDMQCASHLFLTGMCILLWAGVAASPTRPLHAHWQLRLAGAYSIFSHSEATVTALCLEGFS
jgi:hypothetical protein